MKAQGKLALRRRTLSWILKFAGGSAHSANSFTETVGNFV